ncbi:MAG: SUMF1/EgtB/PvdO family nonheme iron enzyme [Gemmatimonadota bacterium]
MFSDVHRSLQRFIAELRRRHILRVAVVYAVVAWGVLQIATLLVPELLLPDWISRAIVVLVLLGFPIAIVLAWAFEITPEGVRRTEPAPAEAGPEEPRPAEPTPAEPARAGGRPAEMGPPEPETTGQPAAGRRAEPSAGAARPARRSRSLPVSGVIVAALAVAAAAFAIPRWLQASAQRRARTRIPRIEQLADAGRYSQAYRLAVQVGHTLPTDTTLTRLWPVISNRLTVTTDPSGAQVLIRPLPGDSETSGSGGDRDSGTSRVVASSSDVTGLAADAAAVGFRALGTTPLDDVRVARTPQLLRIRKQGYATVERLASNELTRVQDLPVLGSLDSIGLHVPLIPAGEAPGMVFVPGGEYQLVTPDLPRGLKAQLDDYFIDRYEVSNADFRAFVTGGGYTNPALWPHPIVVDGDTLTFDEAMKRFVDRTGLPGPREWTSQEPPHGRNDYPVTGVSWYEAEAYCAFRGKRLPSVFQWEKAARNGQVTHTEGVVMPWGYASPEGHYRDRANFSGDGPVPVDAHPFGISPFGAYAMAGNVKEWTANPIGNGRAVTGGSWADPMYVFSEFGTFDPAYATNSLGFRCARVRATDARARRDQGTFALDVDDRTPTYKPVDPQTFRTLLSYYNYDPVPPKPQVLDTVETPDWVRLRLTYAGPNDERVLAYLWLPKAAPPPYQTVVYVPGAEVFYGVPVPEAAERWVGPLVRSGRALFTVVMKGMTERQWGPGYKPPPTASVRYRDQMVLQGTELRLGLDYLQTRPDIDMKRLAYVGLSWGAGSHLVFAGIDDRFRAVVFVGGGIDERTRPTLPAADAVNFAHYIKPPKLLLNGRHDEEHPWFTRGLPLWNLLQQPKKLVLVEDAGHIPPAEARIPAINHFLDGLFGSPTAPHGN